LNHFAMDLRMRFFWFLWVVKIKIENTMDVNRLAYHPSYIPILSVLPCHKNDELNYTFYTLKHVLHFCYLYLNCNNISTLHIHYERNEKWRVGVFEHHGGLSRAHVKSDHIGLNYSFV
jgi:hypothetical protein